MFLHNFSQNINSKLQQWLQYKQRSIIHRLLILWLCYFKSQSLSFNQKSKIERVIVFAPHQDDETLGCGGMIALKRSQGAEVWIVFLTNGEASYLYDSELNYDPDFNQERLIQTRRSEAIAALSILGVDPSNIIFLDQLDGQLQHLSRSQHQFVIERLIQILNTIVPEEIYLPHAQDSHPDHEATFKLVSEAVNYSQKKPDIWQYPIWLLWDRALNLNSAFLKLLSDPLRLDIASVKDKKKVAISAYASQRTVLPKAFMYQFNLPYELFFRSR